MGDNHPAKIAKYLLKGWCLLNEYCPNGQNIPLVRSREGNQLVCAGCDASCPYFATHGEAGAAGAGEKPTAAAAPAAVAAAVAVARAAAPASRVMDCQLNPDGTVSTGAPAYVEVSAAASTITPTLSGLAAVPMRSSPSAGSTDVTLQGPETRFSCVRLDQRYGGSPRLLGESYVAKVRCGLATCGTSPDLVSLLQEAFTKDACGKLSDKILMPSACPGVEVVRSMGQVSINVTGDGCHFNVPERECVFVTGVAPDMIAKWLLEALLGTAELATKLRTGGVRWLEVCLGASMGEVTYRRDIDVGGLTSLGQVANDW